MATGWVTGNDRRFINYRHLDYSCWLTDNVRGQNQQKTSKDSHNTKKSRRCSTFAKRLLDNSGNSFEYEEDFEGHMFIRANFDYFPHSNELLDFPTEGGSILSFRTGDILQLEAKTRFNWWRARSVTLTTTADTTSCTYGKIGCIPSPALISTWYSEKETWPRTRAPQAASRICDIFCSFFAKSATSQREPSKVESRKASQRARLISFDPSKCDSSPRKFGIEGDEEVYESVVHVAAFPRRTLLILGQNEETRLAVCREIVRHSPEEFVFLKVFLEGELALGSLPPSSPSSTVNGSTGGNSWNPAFAWTANRGLSSPLPPGACCAPPPKRCSSCQTPVSNIRSLLNDSTKIPVLLGGPHLLAQWHIDPEFAPFAVLLEPPPPSIPDETGNKREQRKYKELVRAINELDFQIGHFIDFRVKHDSPKKSAQLIISALEKLTCSHQWIPETWIQAIM